MLYMLGIFAVTLRLGINVTGLVVTHALIKSVSPANLDITSRCAAFIFIKVPSCLSKPWNVLAYP